MNENDDSFVLPFLAWFQLFYLTFIAKKGVFGTDFFTEKKLKNYHANRLGITRYAKVFCIWTDLSLYWRHLAAIVDFKPDEEEVHSQKNERN